MKNVIATESTEGHGKQFYWVLFLSVFFRGFRGHTILHHQIEKALARISHRDPGCWRRARVSGRRAGGKVVAVATT